MQDKIKLLDSSVATEATWCMADGNPVIHRVPRKPQMPIAKAICTPVKSRTIRSPMKISPIVSGFTFLHSSFVLVVREDRLTTPELPHQAKDFPGLREPQKATTRFQHQRSLFDN